jgi:hypothetical protein
MGWAIVEAHEGHISAPPVFSMELLFDSVDPMDGNVA